MESFADFVQEFGIQLFLILLVFFVATLFTLLVYSGLFASIDVKTSKPPVGKVTIAYKDGKGPYRNCGSFFSEASSIGPDKKSIGIYYDDPTVVPAEQLRWAVGSVIGEGDEHVDAKLQAAYEKENYKFMELPAVPACVTCVFPHTTMISILIGVQRVYPNLHSYVQQQGLEAYPWLEIYYNEEVHFMGPLSDQMKFFTPGALADASPQLEDESESSTTETEAKAASSSATSSSATSSSATSSSATSSSTTTGINAETSSPEPVDADIGDTMTPIVVDDNDEGSSDDSFEKVDVNDGLPNN